MDLSLRFIDTLDSNPDVSLVERAVAEMEVRSADIEAATNLAEVLAP
jgi:hypothetical protein